MLHHFIRVKFIVSARLTENYFDPPALLLLTLLMMAFKGLPRNQAFVTEMNSPTTTQFLIRSAFRTIFLIPRSTTAEIAR